MFSNVPIIVISIIISIIGISYVLSHRVQYGTNVIIAMIILNYLFVGILYIITINLSSMVIFGRDISLVLFKLAIINSLFSLSMLSSIQCNILISNRNGMLYPVSAYALIGGILTVLILTPGNIDVIDIDLIYYVIIKDSILASMLIIYFIILFLITWIVHIKYYAKITDKELSRTMNGIVIIFTITIISYIPNFFIYTLFFKDLHQVIYIFIELFILYAIIKKPHLFIALTNRIYHLVIFHRSGILLFSYDSETGKEADDALMKGTILIGINHILTHFKQKEEALNLIKIKDRDIILEYNNEYGYAVLLTVNKTNRIIQKSVVQFMENFTLEFKKTLQKINDYSQIIDVSVFNKTKDLLFTLFHPYFKK